jgi:hypothetical protein
MNCENWPKWKKNLGIISLGVIIIDILVFLGIWISCFITRGCDPMGPALFTLIFLLPIIGIVIGTWVIGFFISWLIKKFR